MADVGQLEAEAPEVLLPAMLAGVALGVRQWAADAAATPAGQMGVAGLLLVGTVALAVGSSWGQLDLLIFGSGALAIVALVLA